MFATKKQLDDLINITRKQRDYIESIDANLKKIIEEHGIAIKQ